MTTAAALSATLLNLAEPGYRQFAASLIPGESNILGVRLPALRRLARQSAKENWQQLFAELQSTTTMEVVMLRGMLPGYAPHATLSERLTAIADFVPTIRNWSICDSCCATYKFAREHRGELIEFLRPYLLSAHEYHARFGVVMLLNHYLPAPEWVTTVADLLPQVTCSACYAQMAVAWCACELSLQHPQTAGELHPLLSPAVQQLTQRKIRESRRK